MADKTNYPGTGCSRRQDNVNIAKAYFNNQSQVDGCVSLSTSIISLGVCFGGSLNTDC